MVLGLSAFGSVTLHQHRPNADQYNNVQFSAVKQVRWPDQNDNESPALAFCVHLEHQALMRVKGCANIVQVHEAWHDDLERCSYLRMEYVTGFDMWTMADMMVGRWTVDLFAAVAAQVSLLAVRAPSIEADHCTGSSGCDGPSPTLLEGHHPHGYQAR